MAISEAIREIGTGYHANCSVVCNPSVYEVAVYKCWVSCPYG